MDYIPTFKRGERFNDNYYEFVKGLGVELEKEGYIKEYIQNKWMYIFSDLETSGKLISSFRIDFSFDLISEILVSNDWPYSP